MTISGKTKLLGIFGHPVSHSLSPVMHNAVFQHADFGLDAVYVPLPCDPKNLKSAVQGFRDMGFLGANITVPLKEKMLDLVDELDPLARFTQSVNTIYWKNGVVGGTLCGTTTDPYGATNNLLNIQQDVANRNIALLGNGGVSKALAFVLVCGKQIDPHWKGPKRVTIFGRDPKKLSALCHELTANTHDLEPEWELLSRFPVVSHEYDLLINGTSVGMHPLEDEVPVDSEGLHPGLTVYDIVYTPEYTRLLQDAQAKGCQILTGTGMLVHQGAYSFEYWFESHYRFSQMDLTTRLQNRQVRAQIMQDAINSYRAKLLKI